ncbi:MAG: hypothetical protein GXO74_15305 [Calditrichaeota bacterium]|nr:hypothetical protein [Calditrichota bacterium]
MLIIEVIALLFLIDVISKIFWIIILALCLFLSFVGIVKATLKRSFQVPFFGEFLNKYDL